MKNSVMHKQRQRQLLDKAQNYIIKVDHNEYTPDGKATVMLLYQLDIMIYSLAGIDTKAWNGFLKSLKEAKSLLRTYSKDENIKMENYNAACSATSAILQRYITYLNAFLAED